MSEKEKMIFQKAREHVDDLDKAAIPLFKFV
jgi:hypothetical protein